MREGISLSITQQLTNKLKGWYTTMATVRVNVNNNTTRKSFVTDTTVTVKNSLIENDINTRSAQLMLVGPALAAGEINETYD